MDDQVLVPIFLAIFGFMITNTAQLVKLRTCFEDHIRKKEK